MGQRTMGRYPREVRDAQLKCIDCNAPVVRTIEGEFVCVSCGESPIKAHGTGRMGAAAGGARSSATDD